MELLNIALRFFTLSQLFLFTLMVTLSGNPIRVKLVVILLALATLSYLGMPIIEGYFNYQHVHFLWYPANIIPSLLLLLVWFIFEEKCVVPIWLVFVVSFGVLSSLWFRLQGIDFPNAPFWLQASKVFISIGAALLVWLGRDNDLVEARFKVRNIMVLCLCLMVALIFIVNIMALFNTIVLHDFIELLVLFTFSVMCNYYCIKVNPQFQLIVPETLIEKESEDKTIIELLERMSSERLYTNHDLRVGSLAAMLNVPEYKLRKKINQQLGYRNFNHFVNHYRISEASEKLLADVRIPVLSIALDVGFRSISSFNTAFQAQFGVSPTQYRNQKH